MARFFVNRPIVAMVISIITVMLSLVAMQGLPIAQYPEIVPPMIRHHDLHQRQRHRRPGVGRHARAADQRRRKGMYKSTNANDGPAPEGLVRGQVESDMDNVLTQNRVSGVAADAAVGQELQRHVKKALAFPAGHPDQVAERVLRQQLPVELHDHQRQRRDRPHSGRRPDQSLWRATTRCGWLRRT
jgi:HAE1 family hydrophobic/amphiphilic exporter-1